MIDLFIGNYRGSLHIKHENNKYYWAVECDMYEPDSWEWEEISKELFDMLVLHREEAGE